MKLNGGIEYFQDGIRTPLYAMQVQQQLLSIHNGNIVGFDKVGYQRQEAVISSFKEFIGVHGISTSTDDKVGRITMTKNPLDLAIAVKGYFQIQTDNGVKLTRDGRFKLDKDGNLLSLEDHKVLSESGVPIKLHIVPDDISKIQVKDNGKISVFNDKTRKLEAVATLGIVDSHGMLVEEPVIKQGYCEFSNVAMANEFMEMMPIIRNFEANRQMFLIQNQNLQKLISQLGQQ
ncbi:MAG: flagellar basal body rod C-terminal domain-containing protein [Candidatus Gastranaerophilaceae bacterium]|jgi:flagellar basal body rod protein FlgG|nr:flagellar basal body rod C-terminal domain-containing protein [Candidatus Gastranaerophilaceae bacterium]